MNTPIVPFPSNRVQQVTTPDHSRASPMDTECPVPLDTASNPLDAPRDRFAALTSARRIAAWASFLLYAPAATQDRRASRRVLRHLHQEAQALADALCSDREGRTW